MNWTHKEIEINLRERDGAFYVDGDKSYDSLKEAKAAIDRKNKFDRFEALRFDGQREGVPKLLTCTVTSINNRWARITDSDGSRAQESCAHLWRATPENLATAEEILKLRLEMARLNRQVDALEEQMTPISEEERA